jgi:SAM-dependent methyltransferase
MAMLEQPGNYWSGLLRRIEGLIGHKGTILDVGCSGGFFLEQAGREGWEGSGVEVSSAMVDLARERFGHRRIYNVDLEGAGFPDSTFDAVLLHNLIEHVADPVLTMREVRRVLKPLGVACLTTPNAKAVGLLGGAWGGFHAHFGHVTFFNSRTFERLFREAGLELLILEYQNQHITCGFTRGLKTVMDGAETPGMARRLLSLARRGWRGANRLLFLGLNALGYSRNMLVFVRKSGPPPPRP